MQHLARPSTASFLRQCGLLLVGALAIAPVHAQEAPIAAGQLGILTVDVVVQGKRGGRPLDRTMRMQLNLTSSETVGIDILGDTADEDMQAANAHHEELGALTQSGEADMLTAGRAMQAMLAACSGDEAGPDCLAAKREYEAANARINALTDAVAEKKRQAPAPTGPHRYQQWQTSFERGCGTLHAAIREPQAQAELALPAGDTVDDKIATCGTTFVLDRRAKRITLVIKPINVAIPLAGGAGRSNFIDLVDLDESAGAESDPMANSLTLRNQPVEGSQTRFSGRQTYRSERGVVTTVSWTFTQH